MNETGDNGDSDDECFDFCNLYDRIRDVETSRSRYRIMEEGGIDQFGDEEESCVLLQVFDTINPYLVRILKVLDDCIEPPPNKNKGEPHFSEV